MRRSFSLAGILAAFVVALSSGDAGAVPAFNRQTGQNCVACHAGGQFPELTAYGRLFKLTGYTIGQRAVPLAGMAVANYTGTRDTSSADPAFDSKSGFPNERRLVFDTASVFLAGKITDNIGAFVQYTYNNYDTQDPVTLAWHGHSASDNLDIRYADRLFGPGSDLIYGVTTNNNPTVSDPWNSAPAWGFNVVPGSAGPATSPIIAGGLAQNVAGAAAYAYWNRMLYGEVGAYRTANGFWSFMSQGFDVGRGNMSIIRDGAPYWRLALTHDWGAHSAMLGTFGLRAKVYPDPTDPSGSTNEYRDVGVDGQYQYILDPHALTVTASYISERIRYADSVAGQASPIDPDGALGLPPTNESDTLHMFRAKASYVYAARYGGTLSIFNVAGSTNSMLQTSAFDPANPGSLVDGSQGVTGNLAGNPATRGWTGEIFWQPVQYVRVGLEYTAFEKFNGASSNYDGFGRNASANNALFAYVWASY